MPNTDPTPTHNGLLCSDCNLPQFDTPSGASCPNGHGGALGLSPEDHLDRLIDAALADIPSPASVCGCCGRPASVHEASQSFCHTCYEAGAAYDDPSPTSEPFGYTKASLRVICKVQVNHLYGLVSRFDLAIDESGFTASPFQCANSVLDQVWSALNDPPEDGPDGIVNSGQPGDIIEVTSPNAAKPLTGLVLCEGYSICDSFIHATQRRELWKDTVPPFKPNGV